MNPSQNDKPVKKPKNHMRLPNGFGSVTFLGGNRRRPFAARKTIGFREDTGTPIQKAIGYYRTRQEALQALADYNRTPYSLQTTDTLEEAFKACFKDKFDISFDELTDGKRRTDVPSVVYSYRTGWRMLDDRLRTSPIGKLTEAQLQDYVSTLSTAPRQNLAIRVLRLALVPAYKNGSIPRDIAGGLRCTVKYEPKEKEVLTSEEIQSLWNRLPDRGAAQLLIMLYTGMRAGEVINQDPAKVFLDKGYMIGGSKTEAGRDRIIPIHPAVADLVREMIVERKDGGTLLYTTLQARMKKILPNHSAHDTRHTFITQWKKLRLDDMILANIVGHSVASITEAVYTHRDPDTLIEEAVKFKYEVECN